ncbi:hypothetical protein TrST_g4543 [Triparma strigata]|uniref:Glycine cleavage system transcriptional repressor n=1 Tax=Triparma strigata TaxID=1606541 RepID=A0A9W7DX29_9STRA|nr:hypothetical protein TrST_g4543 [Triparma strigata]
MSTKHLIITAVGPEQPGIVASATDTILTSGLNITESRGIKLGTNFALLMAVSGPSSSISSLPSKLESQVGKLKGFQYMFKETTDPLIEDVEEPNFMGTVRVRGMDQPGIVQKVSELLEKHDMSIERLETTIDVEAPFGGTQLFMMEGMIAHTKEVDDDWMGWMDLMDEIEEFGEEYNIDAEVEPFAEDDEEEFDGDEEQEDYTMKKRIYDVGNIPPSS